MRRNGTLLLLVAILLLVWVWNPSAPPLDVQSYTLPSGMGNGEQGWHPLAVNPQGGTISQSYLYTFDGTPSSPTAYRPVGWDVDVHSRDTPTWNALETFDDTGTHPYLADHGPACEAPPMQHDPTPNYPPRVFQCNGHLMTAIKADGYGIIYLTPPALLDWSAGEATLRWDMSTRSTSIRDWVDVWLTPYDESTKFPLENAFVVDAAGAPLTTMHLEMGSFNGERMFSLSETHSGVQSNLGPSWGFTYPTLEGVMAPIGGTSAVRRDTFELKVSDTHVGFTMPAYPATTGWIDTTMGTPLTFHKAIVQFGHPSYFPQKGCEGKPDPDPLTGLPPLCPGNTWHWDNVSVSPASPITITTLSPRTHSWTSGTNTWVFPAAITNSDTSLRFTAVNALDGTTPSIDLNFGSGWATYSPVTTGAPTQGINHARGYNVPVPNGATQVQVRGVGTILGSDWKAEDAALYLPYNLDLAVATATPLPAGTATAIAATATAAAGVTPGTLTPTPVGATDTPLPTITPGATATPRPTNTPIVLPTPPPSNSTCDILGRVDGQPRRLILPWCIPG